MSDLAIGRIARAIETKFDGLIDMSTWASRSPSEIHTAFLSRGLAALAINRLAGVDVQTAANAVTDGKDDGGIDAIYFDHATDAILLVQSKWSKEGHKTIDVGSATNFIDGIRKIINDDFSCFNAKFAPKKLNCDRFCIPV
jgi:hypothetical protein